MALAYNTKSLPPWAFVQWDANPNLYETSVKFAVKCSDGLVRIDTTMPEEFAMEKVTRRMVIEDMMKQLTIQLAIVTLEET
jgi:hypothetical protein